MNLLTKISESLANRGLTVISESRLRPAVITMKSHRNAAHGREDIDTDEPLQLRGTVIPVHHFRRFISSTGRPMVAAGIDPGHWGVVNQGGYLAVQSLRDFVGPGRWVPHHLQVERGRQDETGWSEPDEEGRYNASREFRYIRKFRKILTMNEENIESIKLLEPGDDPKLYEPNSEAWAQMGDPNEPEDHRTPGSSWRRDKGKKLADPSMWLDATAAQRARNDSLVNRL